jgi:hypothetical protein
MIVSPKTHTTGACERAIIRYALHALISGHQKRIPRLKSKFLIETLEERAAIAEDLLVKFED